MLPRYAHIVDLDGGFDVVQKERFKRRGRTMVRKALEGDLEIERDTTGRLIPIYRDLFQRSVVR